MSGQDIKIKSNYCYGIDLKTTLIAEIEKNEISKGGIIIEGSGGIYCTKNNISECSGTGI